MTSSMSAKDGVVVPAPQSGDSTEGTFRYAVGELDVGTEVVRVTPEAERAFFQDLPDMPISEFLCRPVKIANIDLTTTATPPAVTDTIYPWELFLTNTAVADKTKHFAYIRGDLEVLLVPAFSPGSYGYIEVSFLPLAGPASDAWLASTRSLTAQNCRQVDIHVPISATSAETSLVRLPFYWPYDVADLTTNNFGQSWSMSLVRLANVTTSIPGGVASGSLQVYARVVPGYQLTVPSFQAPGRSRIHEHVQRMSTKVSEFVGEQKKTGPVSSVVDSFSKAAGALSDVPVIGAMSDTASKVLGTVANVAAWFGFSRSIEEASAVGVFTVPGTNVAKCDGQFPGAAAVLVGNGLIENDPSIAGGPSGDFLAFSSLFKRQVLVYSADWSATATSGTVLLSIPITPFYSPSAGSPYILTTAGYCGLPFSYWRGDVTYTVRIVMGSLQRGTLQAYWLPYGTAPPATGDDITNVAQNVIFDAEPDFEYKFTVGYARDEPYLATAITYNGISIEPVGATNGYFCIKVANPFQTQESTATARILVFQHAEDDMVFAGLRNRITFPGEASSDFYKAFTLQAPGALGIGGEQMKEVTLVPRPGAYPTDIIFPGQHVASARALLQKPTAVYPFHAAYNTGDYPSIGDSLTLRPYGNEIVVSQSAPAWDGSHVFSWMTYYGVLSAGIAGSTQYTVFSSAPRGVVQAGVTHGAFSAGSVSTGVPSGTTGSLILPMGDNQSTSFLLPYSENAKFINTSEAIGEASHFIGYTSDPVAAQKSYYVVFQSFGEDVRPTRFLQCPQIVVYTSTFPAFPPYFQPGSGIWPVYP